MISITLCMIVKDEEATLERCLKSVNGIPDEIIIIDTGSTDKTKEIARKYSAKIDNFKWIDDFSAARNYSYDKATKDYILWLDADDVLLPRDRKKLLKLKQTLADDVDAVSMVYHTLLDASDHPVASTQRIRLTKRSKNFRWIGFVHEDLVTIGDFVRVESDIAVTHKKPNLHLGPSARNLQIYEKHLKAGAHLLPRDIFHYARELQMNKKFKQAIPYYIEFLGTKEVDTDLALFTLHNLATCYYMIGREDKEWECTLKSLEYDLPRPEFSCRIGERFMKKEQFRQGIYWYQQALSYNSVSKKSEKVSNQIFKTWLPHKQMAICYYNLGEYERSLHHFESASKYLPNDDEIIANIVMLRDLNKTPKPVNSLKL